jgi:type I restriction enzyme M protein
VTFGSYTIRLRTNDTVNPFALFAFLLTDAGRMLTFQARYGSAQPNLSIPYLRNLILIPNFSDSLGTIVKQKILEAVKTAHLEIALYREAETELLERLGWEELRQKPVELSYVRDFANLESAERSDAEFFHPQYKRLRTQLEKRGAQPIGMFCPKASRGVQPLLVENGEVVVLDSKSVRPEGVEPAADERTSRAFSSLPQNSKACVQHGDVLLNSTGRGTLGRAACYQSSVPALCDNHVAILRADTNVCNPTYLSLFLNSPAGLAQSEQFQTGSSGQLEIYPNHIAQFLIFLPKQSNGKTDMAWQERLAAKVEAAASAKAAARAKLEEAKRLVEDALKAT